MQIVKSSLGKLSGNYLTRERAFYSRTCPSFYRVCIITRRTHNSEDEERGSYSNITRCPTVVPLTLLKSYVQSETCVCVCVCVCVGHREILVPLVTRNSSGSRSHPGFLVPESTGNPRSRNQEIRVSDSPRIQDSRSHSEDIVFPQSHEIRFTRINHRTPGSLSQTEVSGFPESPG